jgi:putative ATP-dependent endonuclease of OLD family
MHLSELTIEGFRRIESLNVKFRPGLNVLVGPNNVGKTAVVDALRALLYATQEGAHRKRICMRLRVEVHQLPI